MKLKSLNSGLSNHIRNKVDQPRKLIDQVVKCRNGWVNENHQKILENYNIKSTIVPRQSV